jgi:hypothetical protein
MIPVEKLREQGSKPVRITAKGEIFIGDDEFPYPVARDSVSVARAGRRLNFLTLTLLVGEVTMETGPMKPPDEPADNYVEFSSWALGDRPDGPL